MHQNHVHRQAVQPGRESRFAAEGANLAVELQEGFLRQILGFGRIRSHAQTERVDAPLVLLVEILKGLGIALLASLDGFGFVKLVALPPSFLWVSVGQVAFSGRIFSDAANYLCVVWLARLLASTKVISLCRISEPFYRSLNSPICVLCCGNPLSARG